ncbi:hypothetical protein QQM79_00705 [Marinobacteraceae bacterium S3BR75-40.1]
MIAPWQRLLNEKLYLARQLLDEADKATDRAYAQTESRIQGALALLIQTRQLYLVLIAHIYQHKKVEEVAGLDALRNLVGEENHEYRVLKAAEEVGDHWWTRLRRLERETLTPRPEKQKPVDDNIIAMTAAVGEDRTPEALRTLIDTVRHDVNTLCERHSEW